MSTWYLKSEYGNNYNTNEVQDIKTQMVTAPTLSIVSLAEARNYLKSVSGVTTDDDLITSLIKASTGKIEQELGGVAICHQTWKQTQQGGCNTIKLLRQPVIGVPTVSYYESFSTVTATNITYSDNFRVVSPNKLHHKDGMFVKGRDGDGYEITFECGLFTTASYTTSSNDPKLYAFKTAILRTVAWAYEQREEFVSSYGEGEWNVSYNQQILGKHLPFGIKGLIMPYHSGEGLI
jgi:hypothetical protein